VQATSWSKLRGVAWSGGGAASIRVPRPPNEPESEPGQVFLQASFARWLQSNFRSRMLKLHPDVRRLCCSHERRRRYSAFVAREYVRRFAMHVQRCCMVSCGRLPAATEDRVTAASGETEEK